METMDSQDCCRSIFLRFVVPAFSFELLFLLDLDYGQATNGTPQQLDGFRSVVARCIEKKSAAR
jgi:hypothetical protein